MRKNNQKTCSHRWKPKTNCLVFVNNLIYFVHSRFKKDEIMNNTFTMQKSSWVMHSGKAKLTLQQSINNYLFS